MLLQMIIWEFTEDTGAQPWLGLGDKQGLGTATSPPHVALGSQKGFQALEENFKKKKITHLLVERKGCCYSQWEAYLFLCMKVFLNTGNYKNHYPVNQHGKAYGC